ncbi:MAG: hypothetical protein QOK28_3221 [Actinomycetota bacterium]|jgi:hypothetical protein
MVKSRPKRDVGGNTMKASAATAALVERLFRTFESGDASAIPDLFAEEGPVLGIGTDPTEWWSGRERLLQVVTAQVGELAGTKVDMGDVEAYEVGDLGWGAARPTFTFPDGNSFVGRLTVVSAKSGDEWRLVQFHLSVGVANDEAVGRELTT